MKNSEILEKVLENYDVNNEQTSRYLCDQIRLVVNGSEYVSSPRSEKLTKWIHKHLKGEFSVREWLGKYHHIVLFDTHHYRNPELKEYRRLWLINMIEYWKHHEASQDN